MIQVLIGIMLSMIGFFVGRSFEYDDGYKDGLRDGYCDGYIDGSILSRSRKETK